MSRRRTTCPYCGVGCGVVVESTAEGVSVKGDELHPANFGRLCSKGAALAETLDYDGRLLYPQVHGVRSSWNDALDLVASRFSDTIRDYGPDSVAFYVSGQLLTEDYYVANKLMKGFIGSANIDTNSRLCMASSVAGYKRAFGADFVPNSYRDIERADLLIIVGSNMAWCHPVLFQRARDAKQANPDMRVVVIDPRSTATCDLADLHLPVKPGTDVFLFNGLLTFLQDACALDEEFIDLHTEGFSRAMNVARQTAESVEKVGAACEVAVEDIRCFYDWFLRMPKTVSLFSQGVNQSVSGSDKVNSIINVHLATGRLGKPGAGPFSLTGQPNAMGGREVGGLANMLAAHMDFTPDNLERVSRFWNSSGVAPTPGLKAVDLFEAVAKGSIRAIWVMSTNPVVSMPNADHVKRALADCDFVVVSDCMERTDTTECGNVLLAAAAWGEKSGTVTNSERRISRQRAFVDPPGEARPDWWIVSEVAKRMGFERAFSYSGPADIFREHARLSAFENSGSRDFDLSGLSGLDDAGYESLRPIRWPVTSNRSETVVPLKNARFFTETGRARFVATRPKSTACQTDDQYPYLLLTGRLRDQWHTMTRTGKSPRLAQTQAEPFVQVHPDDARYRHIQEGGLVRLTSASGSVLMRAQISTDVRRGELFAPMHWSGQFSSLARVGTLIDSNCDDVSGQPELKATPVALSAVGAVAYGFVLSAKSIDLGSHNYLTWSRGSGYWRYEFAGFECTQHKAEWARELLGRDGEWLEFEDRAAGRYRGAKLVDGRLFGCVFVSKSMDLPDRRWLGEKFQNKSLNDAERMDLLAAGPASALHDSGPTVCACFSVGRNRLIAAIREQHLVTAESIGAAMSAGTNCGSCIPELNLLISEHGAVPRTAATSQQ